MRQIVGFLVMLTVPSLATHAQDIYYVDTSFSIFVPQTVFGSLNLSQCTDNLIEEELGYEFAYDVMIRPDGETFGYGVRNAWLDTVFFRNLLPPLSHNSYLGAISYKHDIRGLTCDENGKAYAAGWGITQLNSECCDWQENYLGDLPSGMECQGDITYRKGKFYIAATGNQLVEVDMKDPSKSQVVMEFPPGTLPVHGLATVQVGCDSVATYAIGRAPDHSEVYEINFDDWTISLVCDMPELAITGAGSQSECMLPPCGVFVDLDGDNSSLGFLGNHCADTFCISPMPISDTDVAILSGTGNLDSITFELTGTIDIGNESLSITSATNIIVIGDGTPFLTLIDNGATLADFEAALVSVYYQNNSPMPSPGMRKVLVTGWAGGEASPLSVAELPLFSPDIQLQADLTEPSCHGLSDGSISVSATGGSFPYTFGWAGGGTGGTLANVPAGSYPVTVTDASGCATSAGFTLGEPDTLLASIGYDGPPEICGMSGTLTALPMGGAYPYGYSWDNGPTDSVNIGIGPGLHTLTVTDMNGCTAGAEMTINSGDTVLVTEPQSICEGGNVQWQGGTYSTDTTACLVFVLPNGCDSTVCLDLTVSPAPVVQLDTVGSFCDNDEVTISAGQHDSYLWSTGEDSGEITVAVPGIYSVQVTGPSGCPAGSSILVSPALSFGLDVTGPSCHGESNGSIIVEDTEGAPPFSYSLDGMTFSSENAFGDLPVGGYQLMVLDGSGCSRSVDVTLVQPPQVFLDAGDDVEIGLGESVVLTAETDLQDPAVTWQPPTGLDVADMLEVVASPFVSTLYHVEVADSNGCTVRDDVLVSVGTGAGIYAPNAFSPNGDNINDVFHLYAGSSIERILSLKIYDRWGSLVFEKKDYMPNAPELGWGGGFDGEPAQVGIYVFVAEVLKIDGESETLHGEVKLIR